MKESRRVLRLDEAGRLAGPLLGSEAYGDQAGCSRPFSVPETSGRLLCSSDPRLSCCSDVYLPLGLDTVMSANRISHSPRKDGKPSKNGSKDSCGNGRGWHFT